MRYIYLVVFLILILMNSACDNPNEPLDETKAEKIPLPPEDGKCPEGRLCWVII